MRNLREYPVNYQEKVDLIEKYKLEWVNSHFKKDIPYGDMTLCILGEILEDLWQLDDLRNS